LYTFSVPESADDRLNARGGDEGEPVVESLPWKGEIFNQYRTERKNRNSYSTPI